LIYDCMEWHKGIHIAIPTCLGLRQGYCWMDQYTVNSIPRSIRRVEMLHTLCSSEVLMKLVLMDFYASIYS
jgi:hypothetical protein